MRAQKHEQGKLLGDRRTYDQNLILEFMIPESILDRKVLVTYRRLFPCVRPVF